MFGHRVNIVIWVVFFTISCVHAKQGLPDFTELVEAHSGAVVNISTTKQETSHPKLPPNVEIPDFPEGSPFNDFFEKFLGEQGPNQKDYYNSKSLGSGFIISADGYVVTNHHVVREADEIIVKLSDRREFVAEIIGSDPRSDIALLKIDAQSLPVVEFGSANDLKVGQWVLAIGSPFGFDHSVTSGIVSAKGRSLPNENYVPFIQTDVAINPGNSGGPLFNMAGEVVGINSQIYSRTGGFMGLSFAIPVEVAMEVVEQLKTTGYVSRGWLGVYIQEVTRELAESFGMEKPAGALVAKIMDASPAIDSDLEVGDVIVKFNDQEVANSAALPPMVGRVRVGEEVTLEVMRNGKTRKINVVIGQLPDSDQNTQARIEKELNGVLGMDLELLTEEDKKATELSYGLKVTAISQGPAKTAGVRANDVLQMINGEKIESVQALKDMLEKLPAGKYVSLLVQRPSGPQFLAMMLPPEDD
ncbi:MAG: serine peptidase [Gammaproteobacteria bacterium TMED119]|nr:MAG: serine peptidase [Gammaproteobacteria bacterium TMED119]